jgi:lauroyl/myristoyl acyltransferase
LIPSPPVIRAAIATLRFTPVPLARALAAAAGTLAWAVQGDRRRTIERNMSFLAPDKSVVQQRRLARRAFRNFAVTAVDVFRLPSLSPEELSALFDIRGLEHVDTALARGRGLVIATAHLGPYELASGCVAALGYPVHGMVENLEPQVLEALASYRSATGMQLVNMKDGLRAAYRILGQNHILALVADRAIGDTRGAIEVPFGSGTRLLPVGPAVFAQTTGAALITAFTSPNPKRRPRYLMEFHPPLYAEGRDEAERIRLTKVVTERMAEAVQRNPDHWFVFQPNWITRETA